MVDSTFQGMGASCPLSPVSPLQTSTVAQEGFIYAKRCCDSGAEFFFCAYLLWRRRSMSQVSI